MPEQEYFTSHNNYYSKQTQGDDAERERRNGFCCAASAMWCANLLIKGTAPARSRPDIFMAGVLQVRYRWGNGGADGALKVLEHVGLQGGIKPTVHRDTAIRAMGRNPGVYHICAHGHAFAVDTRPGNYYHYDIAKGLYGYDSLPEWKAGVSGKVPPAVTQWSCIHCQA